MKFITLKVIGIEGVLFSGEITEMILPTDEGQIAVLPDHIAMISTLKDGEVILKTKSEEKHITITAGVLEIRPGNEAYILSRDAKMI